ncbi:HK97 gp10 family phage protein [Castellaniella sp.]|uniref:HK97 gp10 family phage protein n=1 Tax=Castellaniella sp. TaxID=1955812 RepID=UPI00355E540C
MTGSVDLTRLVEKAKGNIDQAVRQVMILAAQGVVMSTPVDTGRLRGSWSFGVNTPRNDYYPTDKGGQFTLSRIYAAVSRQDAGPKFYITTVQPYARRIEYEGWSHTKAPNGMIRITIANLPNAIRDYVRGEL